MTTAEAMKLTQDHIDEVMKQVQSALAVNYPCENLKRVIEREQHSLRALEQVEQMQALLEEIKTSTLEWFDKKNFVLADALHDIGEKMQKIIGEAKED